MSDHIIEEATLLQKYLTYLTVEKNCSKSTLSTYRIELEKLLRYLQKNKIFLEEVKVSDLRDFIYLQREARNLGPNSTCKVISIYKSFFNFLEENEVIVTSPARKISFLTLQGS